MAVSEKKRLNVNDAAWLLTEGKHTPQHVGLLVTYSLPPGAPPTFTRDLVDRWRGRTRFAPPFNYLLTGGALPAWRELPDDDIDLDYHLRHSALPAPGGERELGVLVSRLHSTRLDRNYPLWEIHLIEGVKGPAGPGGEEEAIASKFALYAKVHHSQIDGVGGLRLLARVLSTDPDERDMAPMWEIGYGKRPLREAVVDTAKAARSPRAKGGARAAGKALRVTARDSIRGPAEEVAAPYRAPKTILNGRIHGPRRFATQTYPMERMKQVGKAAGGTVNDVFVAICAGALRRYLDEAGALPEESLTAILPVSVRPADDTTGGNAISFIYAKIGTHIADPVERLRFIKSSVAAAKGRVEPLPKAVMPAYTATLMGPYVVQMVAGLGGFGRPNANLVISNVPGSQDPLYYDGARIEEMFPASLLYNGQALNITGVSYAGRFNIGYTGCRDSLPHMQRIATYSEDALAELEKAVGVPPL